MSSRCKPHFSLQVGISSRLGARTVIHRHLCGFVDNLWILVELSCSTTLVPTYLPELFSKLVPPSPSGKRKSVVFGVCGGFNISLAEFGEYRSDVETKREAHLALCNGELLSDTQRAAVHPRQITALKT